MTHDKDKSFVSMNEVKRYNEFCNNQIKDNKNISERNITLNLHSNEPSYN